MYLEEAFEALHFQHRRQLRFMIGSVFAAFVGVALALYQARLKEDDGICSTHKYNTLCDTPEVMAAARHFCWKELAFGEQRTVNFSVVHHFSLAVIALTSTIFFDTSLLPSWGWILSIINVAG